MCCLFSAPHAFKRFILMLGSLPWSVWIFDYLYYRKIEMKQYWFDLISIIGCIFNVTIIYYLISWVVSLL